MHTYSAHPPIPLCVVPDPRGNHAEQEDTRAQRQLRPPLRTLRRSAAPFPVARAASTSSFSERPHFPRRVEGLRACQSSRGPCFALFPQLFRVLGEYAMV